MYKCNFCQRNDFPSPQSFYAHCRWCDAYKRHKQNLNSASGTPLRQAVPKAQSVQATSPPIPSTPLPQTNDPLAPFRDFLQGLGVQPPNDGETQETPQQKRRRLLQAAKNRAIDRSWGFTGTPTAEMRAAARLAIERELRDEPLEEFSSQEVIELAEGVCDRVYSSFWSRQKKETQRIQAAEERKRAGERENERKQQERTKKKNAFLTEAQRRAVVLFQTRSLSLGQRIHMMDKILTPLDAALTGDESLSEAYASIEAVIQSRMADWDADEAAQAAKQQEQWWELGAAVAVILSLWFMYAKGPDILQWLWKVLSPEPAAHTESAPQAAEDPPPQTSDEPPPERPVRRIRRGRRSHAAEPPSPPPYPESENLS
jgi:hypothetical protein